MELPGEKTVLEVTSLMIDNEEFSNASSAAIRIADCREGASMFMVKHGGFKRGLDFVTSRVKRVKWNM